MKLLITIALVGAFINASVAKDFFERFATETFAKAIFSSQGPPEGDIINANINKNMSNTASDLCLSLSTLRNGASFFTKGLYHLSEDWVANTENFFPITHLLAKEVKKGMSNAVDDLSVQIDNVSLQLRTPCGQKELPVSEAGMFRDEPKFDVNKKTVVFVSGWRTDLDEEYIDDMAKAYHCRGGYNFMVMNTAKYLDKVYYDSAFFTKGLGKFLAVGLKNLEIPAEKIHLIGHSLGAQIVGSAGRHYTDLTNQKVKRITGLDPARPCFIDSVYEHIKKGDADFVDIIHSNPLVLGMETPIGDADFYPGGLNVQKPGCRSDDAACSHNLSIEYYAESIHSGNENNFMAAQCSSYSDLEDAKCEGSKAPMGYAADVKSTGIHYLEVKSTSPYGMNAKTGATSGSNKCGACPK